MSMDKRWANISARLDAIEARLGQFSGVSPNPQAITNWGDTPPEIKPIEWETIVTKDDLMSIKGVGSATADAILDLLSERYFANGPNV